MHKFIIGMDITSILETQRLGGKFFDEEGKEKHLLALLKEQNVNSIRLRLFVNPYDEDGHPYGGGTPDLVNILVLAKEIYQAGFSILLDLHYSDFWADPGKQFKPKAWKNLHGETLLKQVEDYTEMVLLAFQKEQIPLEHLQIGNEITNGMLWPDGKLINQSDNKRTNYEFLAKILNRAAQKVRSITAQTKIILHLERSYDVKIYEEWLDEIYLKNHVDFDILGMSYYPYWHKGMDELAATIQFVKTKYNLPIIIIETSYAFTSKSKIDTNLVLNETSVSKLENPLPYPLTKDGQIAYLKDFLALVKKLKLNGFYYWEPAWLPLPGSTWATEEGIKYVQEDKKPGNEWANQGLFDYEGRRLPAFDIIKKFSQEE